MVPHVPLHPFSIGSDDARTPGTLSAARAPLFYLGSPERSLLAEAFDERILLAPEELSRGLAPHRRGWLVGALPFDRSRPSRLYQVTRAWRGPGSFPESRAPMSRMRSREERPDDVQAYQRLVAQALAEVRGGTLKKVVLARSFEMSLTGRLDWALCLRELRAQQPRATTYAMRLDDDGSAALIGSSPELLVSSFGDEVRCTPLAGSRPRGETPSRDMEMEAELVASEKDRLEHRFLVDQLVADLDPWVSEIRYPREPRAHRTSSMWHLATPIVARLKRASTTALDLVLAVYPTAAVCGVPKREASSFILENESLHRGFYGGAVGYMDPEGNGEWVVTIRGAEVCCKTRPTECVYARILCGAGIIAQSDPSSEARETFDKTRTIASVLACCTTRGQP